ncbi:MAG: sigma-70 family RNA polymerase sigma factor [Verrucomicrobia subdivision 3 bacterium]|nr:sigma-70 family RNA polymerase sigma factor [Limisphaerales bacterium]
MNEDPISAANAAAALSPAAAAASGCLTDPERWVEEHGDSLFKYALVRLRDATKAEDMVQETFLAALKGAGRFAGRSAERSWLIGILKHKILDYYRKVSRETSFTDLDFYSDEERDCFTSEGLFKGGWNHARGPMVWSSEPGASLDSQEFWKTFHDCSSRLPQSISTVFTMREVDGIESKKICEALNISENNLWVMLHRARMALRRCLETHWFGKQT